MLGLPCIVKPNRGCGGRGVYRVDQAADLRHFIGLAFKHDTQVLVEPFIEDGIEVRREEDSKKQWISSEKITYAVTVCCGQPWCCSCSALCCHSCNQCSESDRR